MKTVAKQIPYPLLWDRMPIDISFVFENEKPAGKHGFLKTEGEQFVFEDGTPAHFWGTNFNSGACFPEHSHSEKVAKRLAQTGVNLVRLHQMDAEWSTPNIFRFSRGRGYENTRSFDPESMDRLDYLIYCLRREGIYIYMDFITYRRFKTGDGVENTMQLPEAAKPYTNYSRKLIELQKEFNAAFLSHYNPYTELKYADEPAICMAEIANENDMLTKSCAKYDLEPYCTELTDLYKAYCREKGVSAEERDFNARDAFLTEFFCDLQKKYYIEMTEHLRNNGAKFPITGTNWCFDKAVPFCNTVTDFHDGHPYWWVGDQRRFKNDPLIRSGEEDRPLAKWVSKSAVEGKPVFISEWDAPWPNEFRSESALLMAAWSGLNAWSGCAIHTYRYGTNENESVTRKIGRSIVIGNSYYRGIFDTFNDPAKWGMFYHAALIMRRGDVSAAKERVTVGIRTEDVYDPSFDIDAVFSNKASEMHCVRMAYDVPSSGDVKPETPDMLSDTGEVYRNPEKGIGWIDSAYTKAAYGFIGGETISLSGMTVNMENDYGTVCISSLTTENIQKSGNLLLTAVGRADNTDSEYNREHTVLLKEGKPPILIDVIEAEIKLKTEKENLKIWSIDNEGFPIGEIKTKYEDGTLSFTIGKEFESMYYLIQEQ
ncbi:MAG: hypothetical protein E7390_06865 [Ruminococcaceae bacterium]|nr:hypothetical protein [Oscillospiraceae bacterium]